MIGVRRRARGNQEGFDVVSIAGRSFGIWGLLSIIFGATVITAALVAAFVALLAVVMAIF
jgi:hypothetical protein